jgi:glycosyltransferase involved in cell wall biosynthesis
MQGKISVVINTLNEEETIKRAVESVSWADEILVCDMNSDDDSALVAKKLGAKVIFHRRLQFVEPARNFAVSQTSHEWVLVMDPDEEISEALGKKLKEIIENPGVATFVEIPRKNLIFGKWMRNSMWWPDYNIRFFKKGSVTWSDRIHIPPKTEGQGVQIPAEERYAITHYHYTSVSQFIERMNRYTNVQAKELKATGYEFDWKDLILKPLNEFLSRYFDRRGFDDGLHGLALSLLQAFSFLIVYLKIWEMREFREETIRLSDFKIVTDKAGEDLNYWFKYGNLSKNPLKRALQKAKNKVVR